MARRRPSGVVLAAADLRLPVNRSSPSRPHEKPPVRLGLQAGDIVRFRNGKTARSTTPTRRAGHPGPTPRFCEGMKRRPSSTPTLTARPWSPSAWRRLSFHGGRPISPGELVSRASGPTSALRASLSGRTTGEHQVGLADFRTPEGKWGGSITARCFWKEFVEPKTRPGAPRHRPTANYDRGTPATPPEPPPSASP